MAIWTASSDPRPKEGKLRSVCARIIASPWFASALLAAALVWECIVLCLRASRRPFWYDELLTLHVSSLRSFSLVWSALYSGVDGMPPGYYLMVQLARKIPGNLHLLLRFPS